MDSGLGSGGNNTTASNPAPGLDEPLVPAAAVTGITHTLPGTEREDKLTFSRM